MGSGIFYPGADTDDGYGELGTSGGSFDNSSDKAYLGTLSGLPGYSIFIRFQSVNIPKDSIITEAYITFYSGANASRTASANCYFNAIDNAIAPTTLDEFKALDLTDSIAWTIDSAWKYYVQVDSISLISILQDIVDRPGWGSGNAVQFIAENTSSETLAYRIIKTYEQSSGDYKAELHVTWEEPYNEITAGASINADIDAVNLTGNISGDASINTAIEAVNLTGTLPQSFSINADIEAVNLDAKISETAGISATAECNIEVEAEGSDTFSVNAAIDNSIITEKSIDEEFSIDAEIEAVNLTSNISGDASINAEAEAVNLTGKLSQTVGISATLDRSIEVNRTLPQTFSVNAAIDKSIIAEKSISETCGMSADFECFNYSQFLRDNDDASVKLYFFTLTGTADGVDDITIPISSFQARYRDGESTYLSCVIPDISYLDAINLRLNGSMVVKMAYSVKGVIELIEDIITVDLDTNGVRVDEGGNNQSLTLIGHRTESFSSKTVSLQNVSYRRVDSSGKISLRCNTPDIYLRPGDTATYGSDSFVVGLISYTVSVSQQTMEVSEA